MIAKPRHRRHRPGRSRSTAEILGPFVGRRVRGGCLCESFQEVVVQPGGEFGLATYHEPSCPLRSKARDDGELLDRLLAFVHRARLEEV